MKKKITPFLALGAALLVTAAAIALVIGRAKANQPQPPILLSDGMSSETTKTYRLENATGRDKFERMISVTLHDNGTAALQSPPISSFFMPAGSKYSIVDGELLVFMVGEKEPIAVFTVVDSNTLVFKSSTVALFANEGARYVYDTQNALG